MHGKQLIGQFGRKIGVDLDSKAEFKGTNGARFLSGFCMCNGFDEKSLKNLKNIRKNFKFFQC